MFVNVEFAIHLPPSVNVPADAILDSGRRHIVFVDRGNGYFEPRRVKTGWRLGDRVEIVAGLKPGERIVASGNFLIDSETRMQLAVAGMCRTGSEDPVSRAKAAKPAASPAHHGEVIPLANDAAMAKDPACGLTVVKETALRAGRTSEYQGKTYYFDTDGCKQRFDKDPQRYLTEGSGDQGTSAFNVQSYPTLPMDPATQEQDPLKLLYKRPIRPSRAMPHGPAVPKGLPGGLPLGTVLTGPRGAPPAAPQGPTPIQPQSPTDPSPKN